MSSMRNNPLDSTHLNVSSPISRVKPPVASPCLRGLMGVAHKPLWGQVRLTFGTFWGRGHTLRRWFRKLLKINCSKRILIVSDNWWHFDTFSAFSNWFIHVTHIWLWTGPFLDSFWKAQFVENLKQWSSN